MAEDCITTEEWERFKRFHHEQFKEVGIQLIEVRKQLQSLSPTTPIAPVTKNLLSKQIEHMFKDIEFLKQEIIKLKPKTGV